jgi:hypothetical protein
MMKPVRVDVTFVDPQDDTAENREIVELAEKRAQAPRAEDRDLDQLMAAFGYKPADFLAP